MRSASLTIMFAFAVAASLSAAVADDDPNIALCRNRPAANVEAAIAACTELLGRELPGDVRVAVLSARADHHYSAGKFDSAMTDFSAAIKLNPTDRLAAETHYLRSFVAETLKKDDVALADAIDAAKLDPSVADYWKRRGILFAAGSTYDMALHDLDEAIRLNANDAETYFHRGEVYLTKTIVDWEAGAYDRAMADYNAAIRLKPDYGEAFASRCWLRKNKPLNLNGTTDPQALPDCNEGVRLAGSAVAYNARAVLYVSLQRDKEAVADSNVAVKKAPQWASPLFVRGVAKQRTGDEAGAKADIAAAEKLDPNVAKTYRKYFPWFRDFDAKPAMTERRKQMLKELCPKGIVSEEECKEAGIVK